VENGVDAHAANSPAKAAASAASFGLTRFFTTVGVGGALAEHCGLPLLGAKGADGGVRGRESEFAGGLVPQHGVVGAVVAHRRSRIRVMLARVLVCSRHAGTLGSPYERGV